MCATVHAFCTIACAFGQRKEQQLLPRIRLLAAAASWQTLLAVSTRAASVDDAELSLI
jgi:hypothetical protein